MNPLPLDPTSPTYSDDAKVRSDLAGLVVENAEIVDLLLAAAKIAGADQDPFVANQILEAAHRLTKVNEALERRATRQN